MPAALARMIVGAGAAVNATNRYGSTALHRAAFWGRLSVVRYLVEEHGLDVDARDVRGDTPRDLAARCRRANCADVVSYFDSL